MILPQSAKLKVHYKLGRQVSVHTSDSRVLNTLTIGASIDCYSSLIFTITHTSNRDVVCIGQCRSKKLTLDHFIPVIPIILIS